MGEHAVVSNYEMNEYGLAVPCAGRESWPVATPLVLDKVITALETRDNFRMVARNPCKGHRFTAGRMGRLHGQAGCQFHSRIRGRTVLTSSLAGDSSCDTPKNLLEYRRLKTGIRVSAEPALQATAKHFHSLLEKIRNIRDGRSFAPGLCSAK